MSSFREQKIAKKKREILRSAAAVLAEKGYHGTTMEEIAAQLLMTKGSMYYYFKNKDDILYHCHQMIMELSLEKIEEVVHSDLNPIEKLESAIKAHILLSTKEKSMFMIMDKPYQKFTDDQLNEVLDARRNYAHYFDKILNEGIEKQVFEIDDTKMVRMIILSAINYIQQWYNQDGPQTGEEIAESYASNLLKMVVKKS
ncbi:MULTISPECIES: TetR/AcrR family transcriptional regulator [Neobacillus]|uniref:TetR family transcriptional regulator n=1 Tax=Neobacillus citreus TaxID=2833578 RepID=A0A942SV55_9BACI|nr:TetR/AcrR family transcriptional regulator [Neobacillus citreus]MCH6263978.1 TetR/AcrR family transcriptional regulator [Neobacillus citreus]